jgi:L-alanine-DL-glutamate epimerase-like enolase superfamily enzyme
MASAEQAPMMEFPLTDSPLRSALVTGAPTLADGHVVVGGSPGLGIGLNETVLARYRA